MKIITDQLGRQVKVPMDPKRILSLVPSQTELLYDLDLTDRIAGITKFCVRPPELVKLKPKIGGTKKFNFDLIDGLKPDLILGNKEENYKEGIEKLAKKYPVWISDILSLEDAFAMMDMLGEMLNASRRARLIRDHIQRLFAALPGHTTPKRALYFIWKEPWMVAAGETFINEMLGLAGFENAAQNFKRYPELQPEEMRNLDPEVILLSSEPYPFKEKHLQPVKDIFPNAQVILVDGEIFSWYGSRLQYAPDYFRKIDQLLS